MESNLKTAAEALIEVVRDDDTLNHRASSFVCPFPNCRAYAQHLWGYLTHITAVVGSSTYAAGMMEDDDVVVAECTSCGQTVIFLNGKMVQPATSEAPAPAADMPASILDEYTEAAAILPGSPRGAAALLRLAVQKLLPELGATKRDINDQIGELVGNGTLPKRVANAFDTLRVVGNDAVHPGKIDFKDNEKIATSLFRLLNFIVEKAITEPKHADELFNNIDPGKRDAIEKRNDRAKENHASKGT